MQEEGSTTHRNEKGNKTQSSGEGKHKRNSVSTAKDRSPSGKKRSSCSSPRNATSIDSYSQDTNNHRKRVRKSRWSDRQDEEYNWYVSDASNVATELSRVFHIASVSSVMEY